MSDERDDTAAHRWSPSRRRALQIGGGVAVAAWATPTIFSVPASAQGSVVFTVGANIVVDPGFNIPW